MKVTADYEKMWEEFALRKNISYFDIRFSPHYSTGLKNYMRERMLIRLLALRKDDTFLDVGCASGRQVFLAAPHCGKAVGVDIAQAFVDAAQSYALEHSIGNAEFHAAPAEELPFEDNTFDALLCAEVLEHVMEPKHLLTEFRRVLRPDGRLVVTVPNNNGEGTLWGRTSRFLSRRRFEPIHDFSMSDIESHGDAHVREFNVKSISALLEKESFAIEKVRSVSFIDFPFSDMVVDKLNRFPFVRNPLIVTEESLGRLGLMKWWGRHLVVAGRK